MRLHLDMMAVEAFVMLAEMKNFTQVARLLNTTQANVSLKIRKLEQQLGIRILERTPRSVRLTLDGQTFLSKAQTLLSSEMSAIHFIRSDEKTMRIGIGDHLMGPNLPRIISNIKEFDKTINIQIIVNNSKNLLNLFQDGHLDCALIIQYSNIDDYNVIFEDPYGWIGLDHKCPLDKDMPLITINETCGMRSTAIRILHEKNISWNDVFIAGSVSNAIEAARYGLGIAPLPLRFIGAGLIDLGPRLGLPALSSAKIVSLQHHADSSAKQIIETLNHSIRSELVSSLNVARSQVH